MATLIVSENTTGDYTGTYSDFVETMIRSYSSYQNNNYGNNAVFEASSQGASDINNGLLKATLPSVLTGKTLTGVTLGLYRSYLEGTAGFALRRMLASWEVLEATWIIRSTGNSWGTAGALADGVDRVATSLGTMGAGGGTYGWITFSASALVSHYQAVVDGSTTDHGLHLQALAETEDVNVFTSSQGADGHRPYLRFDYEEGGGGSFIPAIINHHRNQGVM